MTLYVNTSIGTYPIVLERGILERAGEHIALTGRRVCIVTDDGIPAQYAETVAAQCENAIIYRFPQGEQQKNFDTLQGLLRALLHHHFDRKDAIVAIGGGVVTDLAGFAAAVYMRGIDFYNIPTTLLSQVDASVGGKTAVDLDGYKNMIGAFWQPKAVLIDPLTLGTLPLRRISDGLAEVIKMALTSDSKLFSLLEHETVMPQSSGEVPALLDGVIAAALKIKIQVVEQDEREGGLRRILNFGHTLGHAIESCSGLSGRYHGECVALGMLPMCNEQVRKRVVPVLARCGLPYRLDDLPAEPQLLAALVHDKKAAGDSIHTVYVPQIGSYTMQKQTPDELLAALSTTASAMKSITPKG